MALSEDRIREILQEKPNAGLLDKARRHESRLTMHCQSILNKSELPEAYTNFLAWIGGTVDGDGAHPKLLPKSKFERFKQLVSTPLETIELTEAMFTKLNRVFDAEDAVREYKFSKDGLEDEFIEYYNPVNYWKTKGAEAIQTGINSIWVADLPEEQKGDVPDPYGYLVNIRSVIDIQKDDNNDCQHLMYKVTGSEYTIAGKKATDYLMVYDDESIRKYIHQLAWYGQTG